MTGTFTLPTEADELAELAVVGIIFATNDTGPAMHAVDADAASYDAAASFLLRRLAQHEAESDRLTAAMHKEQQLIIDHYARKIAVTATKEAEARQRLELLTAAARAAGYLDTRQTRETTFGEYGWKRSPETVKVADAEAVLAWARIARPDLVKRTEKVTESVPAAAIKPVALALVRSGDECPPGCEYLAESITFIAKPAERAS